MGRTALYLDPVPFRRSEIQLDPDAVVVDMPDGRRQRFAFDGCTPVAVDGFVAQHSRTDDQAPTWSRVRAPIVRTERRFVRMLILEQGDRRHVLITPPEQGAVAPNVVRIPEAPSEAAIIDARAWDSIAEWVLGGGRLAGFAIADLARLAQVASSPFAIVIGEVAAQRALELAWISNGPLRGGALEIATSLAPLVDAAKYSPRAAEALVSALAYVAGAKRPRR
jgi:hypothetical protein